jgi:FAD/FMN-containing dehydrogenase
VIHAGGYYVAVALLIKSIPCDDYFRGASAIWLRHGGRPHWGKLHYLEQVRAVSVNVAAKERRDRQQEKDSTPPPPPPHRFTTLCRDLSLAMSSSRGRQRDLAAIYGPALERFDRVRRQLDPDGVFLNSYVSSLLLPRAIK